ncbi:Calcium-channel protein [Yarrowia sp. C11]|nr:Calcium-channel protein [Yarrowia sp. C11]KAG5370445.1 Calcium-channel protein [Yarrowia sp. E02]
MEEDIPLEEVEGSGRRWSSNNPFLDPDSGTRRAASRSNSSLSSVDSGSTAGNPSIASIRQGLATALGEGGSGGEWLTNEQIQGDEKQSPKKRQPSVQEESPNYSKGGLKRPDVGRNPSSSDYLTPNRTVDFELESLDNIEYAPKRYTSFDSSDPIMHNNLRNADLERAISTHSPKGKDNSADKWNNLTSAVQRVSYRIISGMEQIDPDDIISDEEERESSDVTIDGNEDDPFTQHDHLRPATPLLINVSLFIGFFWVTFSIIGTQSFKASLRRQCVWVDPTGQQDNYTYEQYCGGYLHPETLEHMPYVFTDGTVGPQSKGFMCPAGSICVSDKNPHGGTVSFDNFFNSLEMVFVIISLNTFTDIMYYTMDSDYMTACLFFMAGILILALWLANLLVAVIATSYSQIRVEMILSRKSKTETLFRKRLTSAEARDLLKKTVKGRWYLRVEWLWSLIIFMSLVVSSTRTADTTDSQETALYVLEIIITSMLTADMVLRFYVYLPNWRIFFLNIANVVDCALGVMCIVILIPPIHNKPVLYGWLTIFQILRIYRVVTFFKFTRLLWRRVVGNYRTMFYMSCFFFLLTFLCSVMSTRLLRGVIPQEDDSGESIEFSFYNLQNTFLGMYALSTTENWTDMLYNGQQFATNTFSALCIAAFFIGWFIFSNNVVMNLFIALITENLDVSEETKRIEQIKGFVRKYTDQISNNGGSLPTMQLLMQKVKHLGKNREMNQTDGSHVFDMLMQRHVVQDFLEDEVNEVEDMPTEHRTRPSRIKRMMKQAQIKSLMFWRKKEPTENPFLDPPQGGDFFSRKKSLNPINLAKDFLDDYQQRLKTQEEFLAEHPDFNVVLYCLPPHNPIRRFCQKIVMPSHGTRHDGVNPNQWVWYTFTFIMFLATVALVVLACVATPLYQKENGGGGIWSWITWSDLGFLILFSIEAIIKILADGFYFTPNAYLRSSWGVIDFMVLISLWINMIAIFSGNSYVSRAVRAFKALRALRLLNISNAAKETFENIVIVGIRKIFGAAMISMCLLYPFSVWGLQIFKGRFYSCNDENTEFLADCINEFASSPSNWEVLAPRSVVKPYYDFDNFGHSFLILFEIISLEGWTDVLKTTMSIQGPGMNLEWAASVNNSAFLVLYNFISTIFILTLFIAVIIKNYSRTTGTAFLTQEQRAWAEAEKILKLVKPSIVPVYVREGTWREYCYGVVTSRKGKWNRFLVGLLFVHLILLCLEWYPQYLYAEDIRNGLFLPILILLDLNEIMRFYAFGYKGFMSRKWDLYTVLVVTGALVTTVFSFASFVSNTYYNFQKLCQVGILLLFIPRSERLDQLFKTTSASFASILNLMATWIVLFVVYAIAFNQIFGLTRVGPNGSGNINFRTVPKALILLFRMSCGEGWNQIMSDYLLEPPYCINGAGFNETDCGSRPYAYLLFISWNILSMYIFVNMFVSLIYENFSYVYQQTGPLSRAIKREELRKYKKAWREFDPTGTGYIRPDELHRFLRRIEGTFSMCIYEGDWSVNELISDHDVRVDDHDPYNVDLPALNKAVRTIPVADMINRRRAFDTLCEQVLLESNPDKGISFSQVLLAIPIYKMVDENKCFMLDAYLKRRIMLQQVEENLLKAKLRGFMDMVQLRREFHERREAMGMPVSRDPFEGARVSRAPSTGRKNIVPQIFITTDGDSKEDFTNEDFTNEEPSLLPRKTAAFEVEEVPTTPDGVPVPADYFLSADPMTPNPNAGSSGRFSWTSERSHVDRRSSMWDRRVSGDSDNFKDLDISDINLIHRQEDQLIDSFENSVWGGALSKRASRYNQRAEKDDEKDGSMDDDDSHDYI